MASSLSIKPSVSTGQINSLGPLGPRYEVGALLRSLEDGDWLVSVRLIETGGDTEHRFSRILRDPKAK